jgi:hypothetical protein
VAPTSTQPMIPLHIQLDTDSCRGVVSNVRVVIDAGPQEAILLQPGGALDKTVTPGIHIVDANGDRVVGGGLFTWPATTLNVQAQMATLAYACK